MVIVTGLQYQLPNKRSILTDIEFKLAPASFLVVLGENGAGKTSLLDILMGFRRRTAGTAQVMGQDPDLDPWETRSRIAYLSEKVDMPGDWEAREYLEFHKAFYPTYDIADERNLMEEFRVDYHNRGGNLSAGEIRRLQIVGALAAQPELVIADEITAVLDIHGRKKFLDLLKERQQNKRLTVILATNVPEGLDPYVDYIFLIHKGKQAVFSPMSGFINGHPDLAHAVLEKLERQGA